MLGFDPLGGLTPDQLRQLQAMSQQGQQPAADLSNLSDQGLPPMDPQMAAFQAQQHAATMAAQQEQNQAGQQLQQAQDQPPQQLNAAQIFGSGLLPDVASIISKNPFYRQQGQQNLEQQHQELLQNRSQTLQRLAAVYKDKADAAEQLGNDEMKQKFLELQARAQQQNQRTIQDMKGDTQQNIQQMKESERTSHDQQHAQLLKELTDMRLKGGIDLQKLRGQQSMEQIAARGRLALTLQDKKSLLGADSPDWMASEVTTTSNGTPVLNLGNFTGNAKVQAMKYAHDHGTVTVDKDQMSSLQEIQSARDNVSTVLDAVNGLLPADAEQRATEYGPIKLSTLLQTDSDRAAFGSLWETAIRQLRATAGSKGFRMTQAEINKAANNNLPKLTDTYETAQKKMHNILDMLENAEQPILQKDWTKAARTWRWNQGQGGNSIQPMGTGGTAQPPPTDNKTPLLAAKNKDEFLSLLKANPSLASDPDVIAKARKLKGGQ